ncbi:MAG: Gfo/Idh/MocA family oxidoreductase [Lewinellaceae bacterium]|nr:Gfo/Idh/MocA family oxidoreductase [Lewinellaceae bacterium]
MAAFNIGIVGTGMMLDYHFEAFSQLPEAQVKGCTREYYGDAEQQALQRKSLEKAATELGIFPYPDFEAMAGDEQLDALVIASINPYHYPHIIKALDSGKHVLAEKPVATNTIHLEEISELSRQSGLLVFPSHNFVYRPAVAKAKEILDSGVLGTIVYSSFISCFRTGDEHARGWRASAELSGGGALMDSGYHQVYQALHLLGMPQLVQSFKSKLVLKHMEVEDFAMINARYENGAIANIGQGHGTAFGDVASGIKIVGEKGNIVITDACYHNGQKVAGDAGYANSFRHQARYFIECLKNEGHPLSTLEDARNTLKIINAAYESAENNQVIKIY